MSRKTKYGTTISVAVNTKFIMERMFNTYDRIARAMANFQVNNQYGNLEGADIEKATISYYADKLASDKLMMDEYIAQSSHVSYKEKSCYYQLSSMVENVLTNPIIME